MIEVKETNQTRKEYNREKANEWLQHISENEDWVSATGNSIRGTYAYTPKDSHLLTNDVDTVTQCVKDTTYDCLVKLYEEHPDSRLGALNFASFFNPGGGFLKGSIAQEESLCHKSNLYPVLAYCPYYEDRKAKNNIPAEYESEVIYTPNILFTLDGVTPGFKADILSCAAPNRNRRNVTEESAEKALRERIELILNSATTNKVDYLVVGAWGCGVFRNEPKMVASIFKEVIEKGDLSIKGIVFAIPNKDTLSIFNDVMY